MLLYYLLAIEDVEKHLDNLWTLIATAARYGHQPISEIMSLTLDQLTRFNDQLANMIERENKSGTSLQGRMSTGGG